MKTQPINTMSELKAKDCACPICGAPADTFPTRTKRKALCSNGKCDLASYAINLDQWNTRPREMALSEALSIAKGGFEYLRKVAPRTCRGLVDGNIASINSVLGKGGE